jgi:hypothetical protein
MATGEERHRQHRNPGTENDRPAMLGPGLERGRAVH